MARISGQDGIDTKVDNINSDVDHLHDTDIPAVLAEVEYMEHHLHASNRTYGLDGSSGMAGMGSTIAILVTGGNNVFGTEVLLNKGSFGGTYFDPGAIQISAVTKANSPTLLEFYEHVAGDQIDYTGEADDDKVTASGIAENDRLIFDTIVEGDANGVTRAIVYHALAVAAGAFQVSLTAGGGAVNITADVSGKLRKLTPTFITDRMITCSATTADAMVISLPCPKVLSTKYLSVMAKSCSGETIGVSFFLDVHTYS